MTHKKVKVNPDQQRVLLPLKGREANREDRSVPVLLSTGQRGVRYDFWTDTRYFEELSLEPGHVRLRESLPLIDNHYVSTDSHLGIVRNITLAGNELRGTAYFDKHALAAQRFESVADGFITDNSIGYRVYRYERVADAPDPFDPLKNIPVLRAVDWEPKESSLVAVGFDTDAKFNRAMTDRPSKEHMLEIMVDNTRGEPMADNEKAVENITPAAQVTAAPVAIDTEKLRAEAAAQERTRVAEILKVCQTLKRDDLAAGFIERGSSIEAVNAELIRVLAETNYRSEKPLTPSNISVGKESSEKRDEGIFNAILHRVNPSKYELQDIGREWRGMSLVDYAREFLPESQRRGSPEDIVKRSFMTTSNFKNLLGNVAERTLQDQFRSVPRTFEPFVRRGLVNDFKPVGRTRLTDMSGLVRIPEHGEFKAAEITDVNGQPLRVETYGRKFSLTRQAIINDDLGAFDQLPAMIGRKAATLESQLIYSILKSNPVMNDGLALFSTGHGNLAATPAALTDDSLSAALLAYRGQTTEDDEEFIDISPRYLLVPPALEATALRLMATINPVETANVNLYAGRFQIIVEPRLSAAAGGSDTAWYLMPSKADIETIELANLRGAEGIQIEQVDAEDILGVTWRAYYDVGASAIEWRGMYKNAGA